MKHNRAKNKKKMAANNTNTRGKSRRTKEANTTFTVSLQLLRPTNRTVLRVCIATLTSLPPCSLSLSPTHSLSRSLVTSSSLLRQTNPTSNFCAKLYAFLSLLMKTKKNKWSKGQESGEGGAGIFLAFSGFLNLFFFTLNLTCLTAPWNMCPACWRAPFYFFCYFCIHFSFFSAGSSPLSSLFSFLFLLLALLFFSCMRLWQRIWQAEWNKARLW